MVYGDPRQHRLTRTWTVALALAIAGALTDRNATACTRSSESEVRDADAELAELKARVQALERRLDELNTIVMSLTGQGAATAPEVAPVGTPWSRGGSTAAPGAAGGSLVFTVDSFARCSDNAKLLAEADELKAQDKVDAAEIKRLQEQYRKLFDLFKELEERWRNGRAMSDVEYDRLSDENTRQRTDINNVIARIKDAGNKRKNLEKSKRHDAIATGYRIEGHIGATRVVITTKRDCSKVLAKGAVLRVPSPKSIRSADGVDEYEAGTVEPASAKP